jgi:hypothetical protein
VSFIELQLLGIDLSGKLGQLTIDPLILGFLFDEFLELLGIGYFELLNLQFQILFDFVLVLQNCLVFPCPAL